MKSLSREQESQFLQRLSPTIGGEAFPFPLPAFSPQERMKQRLAFRNERMLYHRICDFSGKPIISLYSPDKKCTVYAKDVWWSDAWDPLKFGRTFDFSRTFFDQLAELQDIVPRIALISSPDADENNCQYINYAGNSKNCYMTFDSDFNEDSLYSNVLKHSKNCMDCSYVNRSELCYECVDCKSCYNLSYSQDCSNCSDSFFLFQCIGCADCLFCTNMSQKQYYVFNKPHTKADYLRILSSLELTKRSKLYQHQKTFSELVQAAPKKYCHLLKAENCLGDYITDSKNCQLCFNISNGEDLLYCDSLYGAKTCMDVSSFGESIERVYASTTVGIQCYDIYFSVACVQNCSNLIYCVECRQGKDSFGSVGLKRHQYCILNKAYSRQEYEQLVPRIIAHMKETGEWGQFLPISLSPVGYNESVAHEFFPLTREQALQEGFHWSDYQAPPPTVPVRNAEDLADEISSVPESIVDIAVRCRSSAKPFRITRSELELLRQKKLPIPDCHPDQRHRQRMDARNPRQLWEGICSKTGQPLVTSYPPDRSEQILCENAYLETLL